MTDKLNPTEWITTSEAAELTGYSPHYVRRLMRKSRVAAKKWGNTWMIDKQSLLDYKRRMDSLGRTKYRPD
jgi:excisionase family DNA binding protein